MRKGVISNLNKCPSTCEKTAFLMIMTLHDNIDHSDSQHWYVAVVHTNTEKSTSAALGLRGIENYVPLQSMLRIGRNGRRIKGERVVIPGLVFVRCTDTERKSIVAPLPTVRRFMMDRAHAMCRLAIVTEREIELLRFMVGQSDIPVNFSNDCYHEGNHVRIVRGSLKGLEGRILEARNRTSELVVRLEVIGCAKLTVDTADIEPIER